MIQKKVALQLVDESLKELESSKGSILSAIQKLQRAADTLGNNDIKNWCSIQLGDPLYTEPLENLINFLIKNQDPEKSEYKKGIKIVMKPLDELGLNHENHYTMEEINIKASKSGGAYSNIGFIEERYSDLVRTRTGNDGTYYKNSLNNHINYVKKRAHNFASQLFNQLKFSGTVSSCFDLLKNAVDDKLLDLNPSIAEQLMLAFKSVSSDKEEEWSQSLTTCRRLLESLADQLYPPSTEKFKGRSVGQNQYVNRLWAFMEVSIQSDSNKDLAKAHIDFLGSWLEKVNKLTHKGVHTELGRLEAVKSVFHTYLTIADLLEYLGESEARSSKPKIATASLDELEALLSINRNIAKEIVKVRVREGGMDLDLLAEINGVGPKTLERAKSAFEFD